MTKKKTVKAKETIVTEKVKDIKKGLEELDASVKETKEELKEAVPEIKKDIKKDMKGKKEAVKEKTEARKTKIRTKKENIKASVKEEKGKIKKAVTGPDTAVILQFRDNNWDITGIIDKVKEAYKAEGHQIGRIRNLQVYINAEEGRAYYVINGNAEGKFIEMS